MIRRRDFITLLGGAAAWPIAARAQQAVRPVVRFLRGTSADTSVSLVEAFRQGLREAGFVEGRNVAMEYRWSGERFDQLPAMAADLVRGSCAVIVAGGNAATVAVRAATKSTPIIFVTGEDPIAIGFVPSLNRPIGNVTGVSFYSGALAAKQLELLREVVPNASVVGMLVNPGSLAAENQIKDAQAAARALGQQIHIVKASGEQDFDRAFATFAQLHVNALLVAGDALFTDQRDRLAALATRHSLPAVFDLREFVVAGGLMSYGSSIADAYRQAGIYAGRILTGAKPADLPVMLPTKFEFALSLKAAKALGLSLPPLLLARADAVVE